MKKILVPCDFSKPAIDAFRFALDIAERSKGTIKLVHVIELPIMNDTVLMPVLNFEEQLLKELRQNADERFKKLSEKYSKEGVKVKWEVQFGVPSRMLVDVINAEGIDLVIMGSHGASGLREYFIGSNAEKMIRRASVPVLVTKAYYKGPVKHIVFPNALETEHQGELVKKVKALQNFFGAHLHLVWINTPLNFTSDVITQKRLRDFAKHFALKDYSINIFNHPNEEEGIIYFTQSIKGDIVAMGTHGRKGFTHLLNGSIAEDIANHADTLLWTYSPNTEKANS